MILFRYILRRFVSMFLRVTAIFAGILVLIGTVDELTSLRQGEGLGRAIYLAVIGQAHDFYRILPLITIIASVTLFTALAKSSELVVVRAAGRSGLRFLLAPMFGAAMIGVVAVTVFDPIIAATSKLYRIEKQKLGGEPVVAMVGDGIWLRQGDAEQQSVIHAQKVSEDGLTFENVTFFTLDMQGNPLGRIEAKSVALGAQAWVLNGAMRWDLTAKNPQISKTALADGSLIPTDLTTDRLNRGFGAASDVGFWALPSYIADLEKSGFSARAHRVWFQIELALPLTIMVMVLVAAGFTMRHTRAGNTGKMVLFALLAGFAIFFLRNFAQVLGQNGQIPTLLAAWGPPIGAALLAISLLLHLEDG